MPEGTCSLVAWGRAQLDFALQVLLPGFPSLWLKKFSVADLPLQEPESRSRVFLSIPNRFDALVFFKWTRNAPNIYFLSPFLLKRPFGNLCTYLHDLAQNTDVEEHLEKD